MGDEQVKEIYRDNCFEKLDCEEKERARAIAWEADEGKVLYFRSRGYKYT